ncbi:non-homologous end-joining factor 1-like isoform X4 [Octopus sinensis]|uniref:Non-homologous end-joining factor 1 n=1 Tax=Octopus sinensis TaxID=2607531 RepID=A0A6P7S5H4_9MOLL|nr:non-homologous end-joining factor 1-like isoform X4 [Octopus sinensis]
MDLETKWRSLWKPDLKCCPWRILQADEYVYLIKTRFGENCYECMITDLTNYWCESLTERECCQRLQELNPNLEAPISKILEHIKLNIDKNPSDNLRISKDDKGTMHIWINSKLSRFPFTWQLVGEPAHEEMVSENMTIPLLMMVSELNRRQRELIHIISKKDLEIEDYRAQSVKLNQKQLATVYFDETSFGNNMVLSKEFEDNVKLLGTTAFESYGQDLYRQIMTKYTWLHKCSKADPGDTSDDNESSQCAYKAGGPSWLNGTSYLDKKEPVKNEVEICPLVTSPSMTEILEKEKEDARRKELRQRLLLDKKKRGSKVRKRAA